MQLFLHFIQETLRSNAWEYVSKFVHTQNKNLTNWHQMEWMLY
jgi:hypothetical protein